MGRTLVIEGAASMAGRRGALAGRAGTQRLADPYLEALRRYAVASRLRHREAGLDVHLLLVAGFSIGQADEVETLVGPWRVGPDSSHRWKGLIILGALALGVYVAALDALDDQLLAFILVGVLLVMIVPFVLPTYRDH